MTVRIVRRRDEMQALSRLWTQAGLRIGFVPTMGNLHEGHLDLVRAARQAADRVVVSIFVNPLQFDEAADFEAYPRTPDADLARLDALGVDAVFLPDEETLYPRGRAGIAFVEVPELSAELEGAHRPGHFRGVTTVVAKLFHLVGPDVAVFGEKDYQQLLIVRRMVADLDFPVTILARPTVREPDGLAMSSRNRRLSPERRAVAPALYRVLRETAAKVAAGEGAIADLEQAAMAQLAAAGFRPEYVAIRDAADLGPPEGAAERIVLGAARLGEVRLIDNVRIELPAE